MRSIAFFKLPPELVPKHLRAKSHFYPANFAQRLNFNCTLYRKLMRTANASAADFSDLVNAKCRQAFYLSNDLGLRVPTPTHQKIRRRLAAAKEWGLYMKTNDINVIGWNSADPDSIALIESGVDVIWLENGYFRKTHLYCSEPQPLSVADASSSLFDIETSKQHLSPFLNLIDVIFDAVDRNACLGYYLQMVAKRRRTKFIDGTSNTSNDTYRFRALFIGQLDYDFNTVVNGNHYDYERSLIETIAAVNAINIATPFTIDLTTRPHPLGSKRYHEIATSLGVAIDNSATLEAGIAHYDCGITINSSGVISYLSQNKPIFFFGKGEFASLFEGNHNHRTIAQFLSAVVNRGLSQTSNQNIISTYLDNKHIQKDWIVPGVAKINEALSNKDRK